MVQQHVWLIEHWQKLKYGVWGGESVYTVPEGSESGFLRWKVSACWKSYPDGYYVLKTVVVDWLHVLQIGMQQVLDMPGLE